MRGWQKKPSAQDDARALLDSLMGPSRDKDQQKDGIREGFKEKAVCKHYLAGLCPNNWFKNTKREMEHCAKVHSDQLIEELKAHPETGRYTAEYEEGLLKYLEDIAMDVDRWIARERGNLKPPGKELQLSAGQRKSMAEKQEVYRNLVEASTKLGDDGEVQKSMAVMAEAQDVKKEIEEIQAKHTVHTGGEAVCEACGVRYPLGDTPNEIGDRNSHFSGKMHEAYTTIREKIEELRTKRSSGEWAKYLPERQKTAEKKGRDDGRKRRSRSRDRDKEKDRDKDGDRDRGKAKKDRPRRRSRSRSRSPVAKKKHASRSRSRRRR